MPDATPPTPESVRKPTLNLQLDLDALFPKIRTTQVAILGDFCLDHYLFLDSDFNENSVETGLPVRGVATQQYAPGGAGNVAANVAALGVQKTYCLGCIGEDPYGISLTRCLEKIGCDVAGLIVQPENWSTRAYVKPYVGAREESRFDYGVANKITDVTVRKIVEQLEKILPRLSAVILNEQVAAGIWSDLLFSEINRLAAQYKQVRFVVDSRHAAERFKGVVLKVNANEAARMHGRDVQFGETVRLAESEADLAHLYAQTGMPVVVTRGDQGALAMDAAGAYAVPGVHIIDEIDIVGAGDTFCSALAAGLGAQAPVGDAILLANWAAAVTVRKLRQTGTASEAEIRKVAADVDYVYEPELAQNARHARFASGLDLEIITGRPAANITCAIFDFDGTISTLREGWEGVMAPMMTRAILGDRYANADDRTFERVRARVHAYIDQSTGIPTLQQMLGLIKLVRDFGFVPENKILDIHGYKQIYNEALMSMVHERVERLERGERTVQDFLIKGAVEFLTALRARGVSLSLASGTDVEDVQREAEILGVAKLFDGGIRGSTKDPGFNSKRAVLEALVLEHTKDGGGAAGASKILACGDGPVELREVRKRGGFALGIASDEVRRYGWHSGKRARLIRAGANVLIPDFSQHAGIVAYLMG